MKRSDRLKDNWTSFKLTLLLTVLGTTCAAQEYRVSEQVKKTYNVENQTIIYWDDKMETPLKEVPVLEEHYSNTPLPDEERRMNDQIILDLMREARENTPER